MSARLVTVRSYRWLRRLMGARTFVRRYGGETAYVIVAGAWSPNLIAILRSEGYREEGVRR